MAKTYKRPARPGYYACGKKKPVDLGATPELLAKKREATGHDDIEMTPLGILKGRGLVSEEQYDAARRFRLCHDRVWNEIGGPRMSCGTLSWVGSDPSDEDAEIAARRLRQGSRDALLDRAFETYNGFRNTLSALHWELLHWAAVYGETSGWHSYGWLDNQIRGQNLRWQEGRIVARENAAVLPATREIILALRSALQAVSAGDRSESGSRRHDGESFARFNDAPADNSERAIYKQAETLY